jgi:hypothetical protein
MGEYTMLDNIAFILQQNVTRPTTVEQKFDDLVRKHFKASPTRSKEDIFNEQHNRDYYKGELNND